jgi:hypothetical protein
VEEVTVGPKIDFNFLLNRMIGLALLKKLYQERKIDKRNRTLPMEKLNTGDQSLLLSTHSTNNCLCLRSKESSPLWRLMLTTQMPIH